MFELITKMYSDLSARLDGIDKKMGNMDTDVKDLRGDIIRIENDLGKKVDVAIDGYKQVYEKQLEHDKHFDNLENKLQKQDVKIRVIKGGVNL